MITIQQIVDIPVSRRVMLEVPPEVPPGRTSVVLVFPETDGHADTQSQEVSDARLFAPFPTIEELKAEAARKTAERQAYFEATGKDRLMDLRDSMKGSPFVGVDGVAYQRSIRDEWPD